MATRMIPLEDYTPEQLKVHISYLSDVIARPLAYDPTIRPNPERLAAAEAELARREEGERIAAARRALMPEVVESLTAASDALLELAAELRENPGIGIGLQYAKPERLMDEASMAMRRYQNDTQR